ncbi:hypothetical protein [Sulfitobacter sp. M13]
MHKLKNERHDAYARLLAKGWNQVPAYRKVYAPDGDCRAAASRLAKRPDVVELIKSIRDEEAAKIFATMGGSSGGSLADLGITVSWLADQYRIIAARSRAEGDYRTSSAAVHNIEKLVRAETQAESGDAPKTSSAKIDLESMMFILAKLAAPTVKIVDDQPAKDSDEVGMLARNRAHRAAARDEQ